MVSDKCLNQMHVCEKNRLKKHSPFRGGKGERNARLRFGGLPYGREAFGLLILTKKEASSNINFHA